MIRISSGLLVCGICALGMGCQQSSSSPGGNSTTTSATSAAPSGSQGSLVSHQSLDYRDSTDGEELLPSDVTVVNLKLPNMT